MDTYRPRPPVLPPSHADSDISETVLVIVYIIVGITIFCALIVFIVSYSNNNN